MNARALLSFTCTATLVVSIGCASIISGRTATVALNSNPQDAQVVIRNKRGEEVLTTRTPATIELKRKDRFIWPARYTASFEKPGYEPRTVAINPTINPWIVGNVLAGGVIGLAIDNATGAAWTPKVASLEPNLEPIYTAQQPAAPHSASSEVVQPASAVY